MKKYFFAPASPVPLAVLRISVPVVLLVQAVFLSPEILDLYGPQGIFQGDLNRFLLTEKLPVYLDWFRLSEALGLAGNTLVKILFLTYIASLSFLLAGYHTRLAAAASWLTHFSIKINLGYLSSYGVDTFALIFLFYLIWMPANRALSVDNLIRPRAPHPWTLFSMRVLQIHLAIIYCSSGLAKIMGDQWRSGEVIWRAFMMPQFRVLDMTWIHQLPIAARLIAWATLVVEIGYPVLLLGYPRVQKWGVVGVIGMHLGIAFLMGLWSFGFFMIALTGSVFLTPILLSGRGSSVPKAPSEAYFPDREYGGSRA